MPETYDNLAEEVLAHHGILGMKWGVRRYQNKDGSLTSLGRKHYGVSAKGLERYKRKYESYGSKYSSSNKLQKKYYDDYIKEGYSKKDAEALAYRKYAIKRALAIAGTVAVVSAGAIALSKYHKYVADTVIKANKTISRMTIDPKGDLSHPFYAAFKKSDINKYIGLYGDNLSRSHHDTVYQSIYKTKDAVKIAGHKTGRTVINEVLNTSPEAWRSAHILTTDLSNNVNWTHGYKECLDEALKSIKNGTPLTKKGYEGFNIMMSANHEEAYKLNSEIIKNLKSKGYSGIIDVHDQKYFDYFSKKPIFFFDHDKIEKVADRVVNKAEIDKKYNIAAAKTLLQDAAKTKLSEPYGYLFGGAALTAAFSKDRIYTKKINEYRKAHPNTDKNYYELLYLAKKHKL